MAAESRYLLPVDPHTPNTYRIDHELPGTKIFFSAVPDHVLLDLDTDVTVVLDTKTDEYIIHVNGRA